MCGFAGRFHPVSIPQAPGWSARASALLAHRGPDGCGHFQDERCELVHRRLALIDLTPSGSQPMSNEDGTVHLVFNGEIYNHHDLRRWLQTRSHVFHGTSDTEVLVHLYEERGARAVELLRGIFAFAIYDQTRNRLVLARDRFGVKPLYYGQVNGQWVFASEMKAILALPGFRPRIDRQACYDFLGLGYVPEPATGFDEITALSSGCTLTVTPTACRDLRYHGSRAEPDPGRDLPQTVEQLSGRLLDAVARQNLADVPVAGLLSGGIDSSLVIAAQRRVATTPPRTFSVRFPDARHDETAAAWRVAAHCETAHETVDGDDRRLTPDAILDLLRHFDQPFADTSCFPMYWVASAVRDRGIICALSGDGGDEAFGGYARFWRANRLAALLSAPGWLLGATARAGRALTGWTRDLGRQMARASQLALDGRRDTAAILAGFANYLTEDQKAALVRPEARQGLLSSWRHFNGADPVAAGIEDLSSRMTNALFAVSLPSDMLRKVDMMSMRASVEVRVPLLDEELVALGLTLPHRLKTDGRSGKVVLRALAAQWLPAHIARRPKHGFDVPLDLMVPDAFHAALWDLLGDGARSGTFLNQNLVRQWVHAFTAGRQGSRGGEVSRGGLHWRVFMALSLELWLRDHSLSW